MENPDCLKHFLPKTTCASLEEIGAPIAQPLSCWFPFVLEKGNVERVYHHRWYTNFYVFDTPLTTQPASQFHMFLGPLKQNQMSVLTHHLQIFDITSKSHNSDGKNSLVGSRLYIHRHNSFTAITFCKCFRGR